MRTTLARVKYYQSVFQSFSEADTSPDVIARLRSFLQHCGHLQVLDSNSASDAMMMITTFKPNVPAVEATPQHVKARDAVRQHGLPVFIKFVAKYEPSTSFKEVEPRMYEKHINILVLHRRSPHFMVSWLHLQVPDLRQLFSHKSPHSILTAVSPRDEEQLSHHYKVNLQPKMEQRQTRGWPLGGDILMMECGQGETLFRVLSAEYYHSDRQPLGSEIYNLLFQIFYTLWVMDLRQVTHYDIHLDNIFCERLDEQSERTFIYFLDQEEYVVCTNRSWFPKLFDWDLSFGPGVYTPSMILVRQTAQFPCQSYGICFGHHPKFDVYKVIYCLIQAGLNVSFPTASRFLLDLFQVNPADAGDVNKDMVARMRKCSVAGKGNFGLCTLDENLACKGELRVNDDRVLPTAEQVTRQVIAKHARPLQNKLGLTSHRLPEWDPTFLPGSYNWLNCVFTPTDAIATHVAHRIRELHNTEQMTSVTFKTC
jgi:hypothetical protein